MFRFLYILIAFALLVSSCRSSRKIQTAIAKKDTVEVKPSNNAHEDSVRFMKETYSLLQKNKIEFKTFSAKINVDYHGADGKNNNVNVFIRMEKDSIIWVSVNALLGIEAMRMMIDKDSVRIMNKLDKEYQTRSLEYLQEVAALPLDLHSLQQLIIGNPIFLDSSIYSYSVDGTTVSILYEGDWFRHWLTMNNNDHLVMHSKLDDLDTKRNRTCFLNYGEYENKSGVNFATSRSISVTEKNMLDVKLDFKQYAFNETLSFPFTVPKNYKRK